MDLRERRDVALDGGLRSMAGAMSGRMKRRILRLVRFGVRRLALAARLIRVRVGVADRFVRVGAARRGSVGVPRDGGVRPGVRVVVVGGIVVFRGQRRRSHVTATQGGHLRASAPTRLRHGADALDSVVLARETVIELGRREALRRLGGVTSYIF